MRKLFLSLPLLVAACASPYEICVANATADLRVIDRLIAQTRGNINRGYALQSKEFYDTGKQACGEVNGETVYCDVPIVTSQDVPVAIDMTAERAKLNSLLETRALKARQADNVIAQCRQNNPEG